MKVAILGASEKEDRYSYQAQKLLMAGGHEVFPITPRAGGILGVATMTEVPAGMDTVTVYLRAERLLPLLERLIAASPRRVIFNPGTESEEAVARLAEAGIESVEACTLVLLNTGSF